MGQHKRNPTAIAAKNGELKPKEKGMSKREFNEFIANELHKKFVDLCPGLHSLLEKNSYTKL